MPQHALNIGYAMADITPVDTTTMAGFGIRKEPFAGVHDPLHAHILRAESGGQAVAWVVLEIIGLPSAECHQLRSTLAPLLKVEPTSLMISATHTHGGPKVADAYLIFLTQQLQRACSEALANSEASWLRCGRPLHHQRLGFNRRKLDRGAVPVDPEVPVLAFGPVGGPCRAIFFQYACHPACLDASNLYITSDWPGFARRHLQALHPDHPNTAFVLGTAGNINTGYSAGLSALRAPIATRNFAEAERLGLALAKTILASYDALPFSRSLAVGSASRTLEAQPYTGDSASEAQAWCGELNQLQAQWADKAGVPQALIDACKVEVEYAGFALERTRKAANAQPQALEAQVLRLGDALIGGFPGEFFAESGMAFKSRFASNAETVFTAGPANGYEGYIPPREAFAEGGYEVSCCRFAIGTAEAFGEKLSAAADALI